MNPSTRVILFLAFVEAGLAALWWVLLSGLRNGDLKPVGTIAEATATISTTLGGLMGALAGVTLVIWFVLRRQGR